MLFTCDRNSLFEAVSFVSRAISSRATLPVLSGLRVEATQCQVYVMATDLELQLSTQCPAAVEEEGVLILPGRLLLELLRTIPEGSVTVSSDGVGASIEAGRAKLALKGLSPDDYPAHPFTGMGMLAFTERKSQDFSSIQIDLDPQLLADALAQVVIAASQDETRQILTGIYWGVEGGSLALAATDSYRLAVKELTLSHTEKSVVQVFPARSGSELISCVKEPKS